MAIYNDAETAKLRRLALSNSIACRHITRHSASDAAIIQHLNDGGLLMGSILSATKMRPADVARLIENHADVPYAPAGPADVEAVRFMAQF